MKKTAKGPNSTLERRKPLRPGEPPERRKGLSPGQRDQAPRKRSPQRARPISQASPAQRAKVRDMACIVTGADRYETTIDPAHLAPKTAGGCDDPLCVVPLSRLQVHRLFDDGKFDLLPYLRPSGDLRRWLPEILHALDHYDGDLIALLQRLTGERYEPVGPASIESARRRTAPTQHQDNEGTAYRGGG